LLSRNFFEAQFFQGFPKGHRYGLWVAPKEQHPVGVILCIQTPGEENNFSRRVIIQAANRFADSGYATLIFDPYGVGDSAGKTSNAKMDDWRSDLMRISHQMRLKYDVPFFIWGLRLGTLLAVDLFISQSDTTSGLLLWAPLVHGRVWVDHLQRSASLSSILPKQKGPALYPAKENVADKLSETTSIISPPSVIADQKPKEGEALKKLGGIAFQASMIEEIKNLTLAPTKQAGPLGNATKIALFKLVNPHSLRGQDARTPPALAAVESNWKASGLEVHAATILSESFWSAATPHDPTLLYEASETWLNSVSAKLVPKTS
jgi:Serine aminopeptidase, S33